MAITDNCELINELVSGENTHQKAKLFDNDFKIEYETESELSYNDIISVNLGLNIVSEFFDVNAIVVTKNSSVLGAALGQNINDACLKAFDCNPVDISNATVTSSKTIDNASAKLFTKGNLIIAPAFEKAAIETMEKNSVRYVTVKTKLSDIKNRTREEYKNTLFGLLVQDYNMSELNKDTFKVETKTKPTTEQIEDAVFAWKVAKYAKSAGIVISKDFKTTAISQGVSGSAIEYALDYACDASKESVLASDLPLTVYDLNVAAQGRISLIIVPSANKEFIKRADEVEMIIITTGFSNLLS